MSQAEDHDGMAVPHHGFHLPHPFVRHTFEAPRRSLGKAVSWRIWASLDTFLVTWAVALWLAWAADTPMPSSWDLFVLSFSVSVGEIVTKTAHYWVHERIWARIRWGIR